MRNSFKRKQKKREDHKAKVLQQLSGKPADTRKANTSTKDQQEDSEKKEKKAKKERPKKASEMKPEEKTARNRAASVKKKANAKAKKQANKSSKTTGSDADQPPPPAAHPNQREPKKPPRKVQLNNSIDTPCWYYQTWFHTRICEDYLNPARGCKYNHRECYSLQEYRSLTIPPEVMKVMKEGEKKAAAQGLDAPHRPPKAGYTPPSNGRQPTGDKGGKARGNSPYRGDGKGGDKGKGKKGSKGKGKKGKGKGKRKGAASQWGDEDWYEEDDSNYQLLPNGQWQTKDWVNGWMGEDGYTWINPPESYTEAGTAQQQQQSLVREVPQGAGSTIIRKSTVSRQDRAPATNAVLDNNGKYVQLSPNAAEFNDEWGVGVGERR